MSKQGKQFACYDMVFNQDDLILPNEKSGLSEEEIALLINVKCPAHLKNKCQHGAQNKWNSNDYLSPPAHHCESLDTIDSSASSNSDEKCNENKFPSSSQTDRSTKDSSSRVCSSSHTDIMMERWRRHVERTTVERKDAKDALGREPNSDNGQPEYAQNNYLILRQQEESNRLFNYFEEEERNSERYQRVLPHNSVGGVKSVQAKDRA